MGVSEIRGEYLYVWPGGAAIVVKDESERMKDGTIYWK